ncbi:transcriptional regulator [Priestia megaterium]|uniref:PocR ligand-binding domain-containing protein n=1 Tax=Priestia megaterium TaxID=1404 RepID=UPI000E18F4DA|nr:PocR ligand-binding domain-containing protein [Priestia megaterium]SUV04194.1 transcriptional regulator [Priestia megaterium]
MKTTYMNLDKILDLKKWRNLQDSLALVTRLAIVTVNYKGVPISQHSGVRPFCETMRKNPNTAKLCEKCDARGGLEAVRTNAPYIYLCHWNIVDIAIPIIIDDKYVGAIMAGEVKIEDGDKHPPLEQMLTVPSKGFEQNLNNNEEIQCLYDSIPTLSYTEINEAAQMLYRLCNYIVEEAMNKNLILEVYEKMAPVKENLSTEDISYGYSLDNIQNIKKELANTVTNAYVKTSINDHLVCKNKVLQPAFDYIYKHKREKISQQKMADLCHISTGYFSRVFTKETGMNFSVFISLKKIEWSKQLLEKTDLSIAQISDELGFNDPGYYIKTFKKYENITPNVYRKYYQEKM